MRCKPPENPNVPNNNTGIILSIIPVLILVVIYDSISIENTDSIMYYCTFTIVCYSTMHTGATLEVSY